MTGSKMVNELNARFQNSSPEEVIGYFLKDFSIWNKFRSRRPGINQNDC